MKSGLLWYDASIKSIDIKIEQAAQRYKQKFGVAPNMAFVNPKDLRGDLNVQNIEVRSKPTIMPNHIWLGVSK